MTHKHTPGPWQVIDLECDPYIVSKFEKNICQLYEKVDSPDDPIADFLNIEFDNAKANARLIAAAPELLEALIMATERCQLFLDTHDDMGDRFETQADIDDWHAAIAKATGAA